jgi:hypothetical protein
VWQREHFFQTDNYSGLTPNICYKIQRFFKKFNSDTDDATQAIKTDYSPF